jgi:hypothetical protein
MTDSMSTIAVVKPGEYRLVVVSEDRGRELERSNPEGKLMLAGAGQGLVWIEPVRFFGE